MRLPSSRLARVVGSLVVVAAVAGITLGLTTLLGLTFDGGAEPEPAEGALSGRGPGLAICVQGVEIDAAGQAGAGDPDLEAAGKSAIEAALIEVAKHPNWELSGRAATAPVVDIGCPSPPLVVEYGLSATTGPPKDKDGTPRPSVTTPSYYRLFVFVMPSLDDIDRVLGQTRNRVVSQEFISVNIFGEGPTLMGVTRAIYVTPEEIQSGGPFLVDLLAKGAGLGEPLR